MSSTRLRKLKKGFVFKQAYKESFFDSSKNEIFSPGQRFGKVAAKSLS